MFSLFIAVAAQYLFYTLFLLAIFTSVRSILKHTSYWQVKEYRLDRMCDSLSIFSGWKKMFGDWFGKFLFLVVGMFFLYSYIPTETYRTEILPYIVNAFIVGTFIIFILETVIFVKEIAKHSFTRPKPTTKALAIMGLSFALVFFAYIQLLLFLPSQYGLEESGITSTVVEMFAQWALAINVLIVVVVPIVVSLFWPLTLWIKKYYARKAEKYLSRFPNIKVIGITGSYGKSSTREFLTTILSEKYKVFTTSGNVNTEIGVAKAILQADLKNTDIAVIEMGAYRKGEIEMICKIVHPEIGILTGLNAQHAALFGSINNVLKAKYELIHALPNYGTAFFNVDVPRLENAAEITTEKNVMRFGLNNENVDFTAKNILVSPGKIEFDLLEHREKVGVFEVSLQGKHNVYNLLGAIGIARELKLDYIEIRKGLQNIQAKKGTMNMLEGLHKSVFINDTYNSNPDGIIAALDYLSVYEDKKKIVVISSMIELGEDAKRAHIEVGKKIGKVCDTAYIVQKDYGAYLVKGMKESEMDPQNIVVDEDLGHVESLLSHGVDENTIILFSGGYGPDKLIEKLTRK